MEYVAFTALHGVFLKQYRVLLHQAIDKILHCALITLPLLALCRDSDAVERDRTLKNECE